MLYMHSIAKDNNNLLHPLLIMLKITRIYTRSRKSEVARVSPSFSGKNRKRSDKELDANSLKSLLSWLTLRTNIVRVTFR